MSSHVRSQFEKPLLDDHNNLIDAREVIYPNPQHNLDVDWTEPSREEIRAARNYGKKRWSRSLAQG